MADLDEKLLNLRRLKENPAESAPELPLGLSANYWLSLLAYDQVAEIKHGNQRILILQGERDYQVTMEDFRIWQSALQDNKKAGFKSYPALNHLFLEGEGPSYPVEYQREGHIPHEVIRDIADWILMDDN